MGECMRNDHATSATAPPLEWSLEMLPVEAPALAECVALLAPGTRVFLPWLPRQTAAGLLAAARAVRAAGFEPVPHLAARRIAHEFDLPALLAELVADAQVRRVLVVAGDAAQATGPYKDSLALLGSSLLARAGLVAVGFAAHPEGHPVVDTARLRAALADKLAAARAQGLAPFLVTQFSFAPQRVRECVAALARDHAAVPLHVGLAGPCDPLRLLRYARLCGVNASRRALSQLGTGIARLAMHTDPGAQVALFAQHRRQHGGLSPAGLHVFSFGGFLHTAAWIAAQHAGSAQDALASV